MTSLTPMASRRIKRDIRHLFVEKENLNKDGIHFLPDESQMNILRAMFIGPEMSFNPFKGEDEETPYFGGYYFFLIKFPGTYPFDPMQVEFMTQNRNWRCNPNFYTTGKVCLSSINTWGSNEWSPERTVLELFMIIRARLDANPIRYEPGYENEAGDRNRKYNSTVRYGNWLYGVLQMLNQTPHGFEVFTDIMKENFIKNYPLFEKKLLADKLIYDKQVLEGSIYGNKFYTDYNPILIEFRKKYYEYADKLSDFDKNAVSLHYMNKSNELGIIGEEGLIDKEEDKSVDSDSSSSKEDMDTKPDSPVKIIIKKKKRVPNENVNDYEVGFQIMSSNDNKKYEVKISPSGNKRWYRV